ncbi:adenosylcobinamide-GDP ribazoletransferase [Sulfurospirillum arcachonense]|uniref:adenosylcobinamide-GDP ribazoletransferase n=1 Tax=Sulfurospirillum arcachonense TaxID=57666 RepID=UPI000468CB99|nr:adenosylcobinamide-GDP ribazoletransferase [Sulfurospirillum arcachonense]
MNDIYLGLKFAFSYYSIVPIRFNEKDDLSKKEVLGYMQGFFPLVGLVISSMSVGLYFLLEQLSWFGGVISAVSYIALYGFLHFDAVMDVTDGIYAKHSGKDAYAIIKDPTVGALGVLWTISFLLIKISGLVYLFSKGLFLEVIAVCIVSRFILLLFIKKEKFKSSFVDILQKSLSDKILIYTFFAVFVIGLLLVQTHFIVIFILGIIFSFSLLKIIVHKLGFLNGDGLGSVLEGTEILLFISVALLWQ